jgi:hypothetical protein
LVKEAQSEMVSAEKDVTPENMAKEVKPTLRRVRIGEASAFHNLRPELVKAGRELSSKAAAWLSEVRLREVRDDMEEIFKAPPTLTRLPRWREVAESGPKLNEPSTKRSFSRLRAETEEPPNENE